MKARTSLLLCLTTILLLSLLIGIQTVASEPPAAPPIPTMIPPIEDPPTNNVPITILPSSHKGSDSLQTNKVIEIVKSATRLSVDQTPYREAKVKVLYNDADAPAYLIVYLLHADDYLVETEKITLGQDYSVASVERDYVEQTEDYAQQPTAIYSCPDDSVQMVFSTCCTGIPTAVAAIERAGQIAEEAGYTYELLFGPEENVAAIQSWLSCPNLMAFGRVGHGNTTGIMLYNGMLSYTWFESLSPTALTGKTLYFNSCQVHNPPLEPAILGAGVQRYIGGDHNLLIGPSEEVFKCFWDDVMLDQAEMHPTLFTCEDIHYPYSGAHGISPDTGADILPWPQTNTCLVNLEEDWHNCWFVSALDFVLEPTNHKTVFKVNLDPAQFGYTSATYDVYYGQPPNNWTVNIGDSRSNNGFGGDARHQSNDAEMQIRHTTLGVWSNDYLTIPEVRNMLNLYNIVGQGDTISLQVKNYYLGWTVDQANAADGELRSPYLYALDGQPDNEGPINYDIYAGFNRSIYTASRYGSGVTEVTVTMQP